MSAYTDLAPEEKYKRKIYQREYYEAHRERRNELNRKWYSRNKALIKDFNVRKNFGISLAQYTALFEQQNGLCGICECPLILGKTSHLDHCHATGKLRKFLCVNCNRGIGYMKDNVVTLQKAIVYINKFKYEDYKKKYG